MNVRMSNVKARAGTICRRAATVAMAAAMIWAATCAGRNHGDPPDDPATTAPPAAAVDRTGDDSHIKVDHPERFALVAAAPYDAASTLDVTGVVTPDVSRTIPVVSLASGRVVDLRVRLGDSVAKGQLLMRIQSPDVADAIAGFRKAEADDRLAHTALARSQDLFAHKALARRDIEGAENAADKADVDLENARQHLRLLGADPAVEEPSDIVDVIAPASGVVVEQNVTAAAGVKTLDNSPNLLTIADLSRVWIVCDVHEADLASVKLGDTASVRVAAYPERPLTGRVGNIGAMLDPALRTAKVRIEVANPGMLRVGLFVTASLRAQEVQHMAAVPATAVLHLHDRAWVYAAAANGAFERRAVVDGGELRDGMLAIRSGLRPGERVVKNALIFQDTVEH